MIIYFQLFFPSLELLHVYHPICQKFEIKERKEFQNKSITFWMFNADKSYKGAAIAYMFQRFIPKGFA